MRWLLVLLFLSSPTFAINLADKPIFLFNGAEHPIDNFEAKMLKPQAGGRDMAMIPLRCASPDGNTYFCGTMGRIVSVELLHEAAQSTCLAARTFGAVGDAVWVRAKCRGTFLVRVEL